MFLRYEKLIDKQNETIYSVKKINDLNKTKKKQLNKIKIMNSVSFFQFTNDPIF